MKILVTGGSGFIGSHIVDKLVSAGHMVRILDLKPPYQSSNVEFIKGDFLCEKDIKKAIKNIDAVYHIAGFSNIDYVKENPIKTVELNILGTAKLLDFARKNKVKRFLFASSVYVNETKGHIYTTSKMCSERLCKDFFTLYGLPYTILRYGTAYGPRSRMADVISIFVDTAYKQNKIFVFNNGRQTRNFIFVEDLAEASVRALGRACVNKTYLVSGAKATSIRSIALLVRKKFNNKPKIINILSKKRFDDYGGKINAAANINIFKELKFKQNNDLEKGLEKFINWYLKEK